MRELNKHSQELPRGIGHFKIRTLAKYNTKTTKNFTLFKIADQEGYEDPIVKAEREFFEIIKQEQEARLDQRQKKQDPSAQIPE